MIRRRLCGIFRNQERRKNGCLLAAAVAGTVVAGTAVGHAATSTWLGGAAGGNNWSISGNWSAAPVTGSTVLFNGTSNLSSFDDVTTTINNINFASSAGAFTISSSSGNTNSLIIDGGGSALDINNSSANLQTIDAPIDLVGSPSRAIDAAAGNLALYGAITNSNNSGVIFEGGSGFMTTLYAVEPYTDGTTAQTTQVYSGTLQIGAGGNIENGGLILGNATASTLGVLTLSNSITTQSFTSITTSTAAANGSAIVGGSSSVSTINPIIASGNDTFFGNIGGSGTNQNNVELEVGGLGTGAGTFTLHNSDTYTGGTVIQNGTLVIDSGSAYPANTPLTMGDSNNDSPTLNLDGQTTNVSNLTVVGSGTPTIGNSSSGKGTFEYNGGSDSTTYAGLIVNELSGGTGSTELLVAGGTLALTNSSNSYAGGTQLNGGLFIFNQGCIGTGTIDLDAGTLQYSSSNTVDLSTTNGVVMANSGGTINTNGNNVTFATAITPDPTGTGGFTKAGPGTLTFSADNLYTQKTTVSGGTLLIASAGGISSTTVSISSGATLTASGSLSTSTALTVNGTINSNVTKLEVISLNGAGNVNLNNASILQVDNGGIFSGSIADGNSGGSLTVTAGLLSLSGSSTYIGATNVNGGTLVNNGDLADTAVTIAAGAVLAGNSTSGVTGTFGGAVSDGGLIAPGSSGAATGILGTLNFLGNLSFTGSSAAYDCDIENAGSASDSLDVAGNLALGTGTALNINVIDSASGSTYTIATYDGTLTGTFAEVNSLPPGYSIDYGTGNDSAITLVVPEPTTLSVLGGVSTLLVLRRRKSAGSQRA
jgi:fibronectin-binding autotransporter adhesin